MWSDDNNMPLPARSRALWRAQDVFGDDPPVNTATWSHDPTKDTVSVPVVQTWWQRIVAVLGLRCEGAD